MDNDRRRPQVQLPCHRHPLHTQETPRTLPNNRHSLATNKHRDSVPGTRQPDSVIFGWKKRLYHQPREVVRLWHMRNLQGEEGYRYVVPGREGGKLHCSDGACICENSLLTNYQMTRSPCNLARESAHSREALLAVALTSLLQRSFP